MHRRGLLVCSGLAVALGSGEALRKEGRRLLPGILRAYLGEEVPRTWDGAGRRVRVCESSAGKKLAAQESVGYGSDERGAEGQPGFGTGGG